MPVDHSCYPCYSGGRDQEDVVSSWEQISKYPTEERANGVIPVVQHLPTKHELLSSNFITAPPPPKALKQKAHPNCPLLTTVLLHMAEITTHTRILSLTYDKIL
jgi:hypothetical protein